MRFEDRAFTGSLAAGIGFALTVLQAFVQLPILLKYWGAESYGIWITLAAALTLINCLDVGHQTYVGNLLCRVAVNSSHRIRWVLGSAVRMSAFLGVVELLLTAFVVFTGLSGKLFGLPPENNAAGIQLGLLSYAVYWLLLGSVGGVLVRLYAACGMFTRMMVWGIIIRFLQFCALLVAAKMHSTPGGAVVAQCAVGLLIHVFLVYDLLKTFPNLFPWWTAGRLAQGFRYFKRSIVLTFNSVMEQLNTNASLFFISGILGSAMIPPFAALRMIANAITQATGILLSPLTPELVKFHVRNEEEKVRQTIATTWFISGFLNFGLLGLALFIEPAFRVWTRGRLTFSFGLFALLAFSTILRSFGSPLVLYISGLNRLREQTVIVTSRLLVTVGLGLVFLKWWGVSGMALAIVLGEMVSSLALPLLFVTGSVGSVSQRWPGAGGALGHLLTTGVALALAGFFPAQRKTLLCAGLLLLVLQSRYQWLILSDEVRHRVRSVLHQRLLRFLPGS